jgi:hypothetical protein
MTVTVEDNVPIPPKIVGRGRPPSDAFTRACGLKPGQCVVCETVNEFEAARYAVKKNKWRYTGRKIGDKWKVWRLA